MRINKNILAVWCACVWRLFFCAFQNECSKNLSVSQLGCAYSDLVRDVDRPVKRRYILLHSIVNILKVHKHTLSLTQ